jgi:hypothetical protein
MFCFSRPNRSEITALLSAQQNQTFSYSYVGYSRQQTPKGYVADGRLDPFSTCGPRPVFKIDLNTACEPRFAETPGSITKIFWPVFWSKMTYSPGEDVVSVSILTLTPTRLSTASRQSTLPIEWILKISKEGTIDLLIFLDAYL